ncbi:MAG: cytochrome c1 [Candidatus Berkiellales bacterium]
MKANKAYFIIVLGIFFAIFFTAQTYAEDHLILDPSPNNLCDQASLQRGAKLYMNYCSGCHSLQYMRFDGMANDIGIVDKDGKVLDKLVERNLNFVSDKVTDPLDVALPKKEAIAWFGVPPPDLSLVARSRGPNWLYTYLRSFYEDPSRPWGVNNVVFPEVSMPNVLQALQGTQIATKKAITVLDDKGHPYDKEVIDHLVLKTPGKLKKQEFDQAVTDIVNFLEYVGEPHKLERQKLGVWVVLFLILFTVFAYLLKREYWKDVD